ncbi:class I adenylate-forming enzyme family protein [Cognatiyoonia koreensis]|nr:class I adenylate-forming enzyme family protein [Cognatiyoonia koreensis]
MDRSKHFNMADYVLRAGRATPDKLALEVVGVEPNSLTFAELERSIRGVATGLLDQGIVPGDRVLLRLSNTPLFPICYLAAISVGLVPVPTSPQLVQAEVEKIASVIAPALTVASRNLPVSDGPVLLASDIEAMQARPAAKFDFGDPERPAYIVFTSGTGGIPRAVVHAHRAVLARQMMFDGWYGLRPDDRLLHAGAFNWTYTMGTGLIDPWTIGATSLIPACDTGSDMLPRLLAQHSATIFAAAPGVYRKMLKSDFPATPCLRHGLSAGEKLPDITREDWLARTGTAIYEAYGMSECSTFISGSPARPAPVGTLGYPQPGRKVKLDGDGTIAIHRTDPGLMLGYLDGSAATAARFNDEWFLTGDIGAMTPDGAVRYEGRSDDLMNAGGLRVSPVEVENALHLCSPAQEWACAAVQVKPDVSVIAAFYSGADMIDEEALRGDLSAQLAAYKIPRVFVPVQSLPRGANNKLLRRQLRTAWEATHGKT